MKIPEPKKLPSGSWRVQLMIDGTRLSITAPTKQEAVAKAAAIKTRAQAADVPVANLTVGAAIDRYIDSKDAVLSPSTVRGYRSLRRNVMQDIMGIKLSVLTTEQIQRAINAMTRAGKSPKYVENAYRLLTAVLREYRPNFALGTTLPAKSKPDIKIPSEEEQRIIIDAARGTRSELPILLTLWLGLRPSETIGLTWDCVRDGHIHVKQAIVRGEDGWVEKNTAKTYSGDRWLPLPEYLAELIDKQPHLDEHIVHLTEAIIYDDFSKLCRQNGLPHYRFYDLRHANASVMLQLGVPDKYAMERMGHSTPTMLKRVYQHTMAAPAAEFHQRVDDYFSEKIAHEIAHEK